MKSPLTTLCYIERDDAYLMLHRVKKENDMNHDKWLGVGGHFEDGESPEDCLLREVQEETSLILTSWRFRGLVTFCSDCWPTEYMHLFTADSFIGEPTVCDEGELEWVPKKDVCFLPVWEGDKIFLRLLAQDTPFFRSSLSIPEKSWLRLSSTGTRSRFKGGNLLQILKNQAKSAIMIA